MGSFFYFSGLLDALDEFAEASKSSPHLKFLLVGGGEQDYELRQKVANLGLSEKVIFTGFVSYEELPRYLKTADVAVNTLEPTLVANVAFPNKVLQYMAAGLPIVSVNLEGLQAIFGSEASILWEKDAASVIKKAAGLDDSELMGMRSETSKLGGLKDFNPDQAVRDLEIDIQTLTGEARH
jgi:glycosyltransferase involved in cell wall biosynthesis